MNLTNRAVKTVEYLHELTDGDETLIADFPAQVIAAMVTEAAFTFPSHRMAAIMVWSVLMRAMMDVSGRMVKH